MQIQSSEIRMRPTLRTPVEEGDAGTLMKLIDALEENDDVQAVHGNFDVDDARAGTGGLGGLTREASDHVPRIKAVVVVLGIDPGIANTGYGVVLTRGSMLAALDGGVIATAAKTPPEQRLARIHADVCALIEEHRPDAIAIEELYFGANASSAFAVGQARGVVLLAAGQARPAVLLLHARSRSSRRSAARGGPPRTRCSVWSGPC